MPLNTARKGTEVRVDFAAERKILIEDNGGGVETTRRVSEIRAAFLSYRQDKMKREVGLGLSIVARIAELHHYRFRLENIEDQRYTLQGLRAVIEL